MASRVPTLVCEYDSQRWFVCPSCHNVIEYDYATNCYCCGQALSWYGTMSQAHPLGAETPVKKSRVAKAPKPEIASLQDQLREKQSALRRNEAPTLSENVGT